MMLHGYIGFHGRRGIGHVGESGDLVVMMLYGYIGFSERCGIGHVGEIDDLSCYDAVWLFRV